MKTRVETIGDCTLYHGDCRDIVPTLQAPDVVVTDPPYGMGKGKWDKSIPKWLPLVRGIPTAAFCGVVGLRDYPTPDWIGAWVRLASTQRIGALKGFNNWEPILFYNMKKLSNDVIVAANLHDKTIHPTVKPDRLMRQLVERMPSGLVMDLFMGSGATGAACVHLKRAFIGIEKDADFFDLSCRRIELATRQGRLI